ncbi:MAG: acyltransferase [Fimbriimonadaceae bacterium]|nr:acyltransferase [Fimbriimonadaceae bacterium]
MKGSATRARSAGREPPVDNIAYDLPFAAIGADVQIYPQAKIVFPERIRLGDNVRIDDFTFVIGSAVCDIGSFVHVAAFTSIFGGGEVVIEDFVGLSPGVRLQTASDDYGGGSLTNATVPPEFTFAARRSYVRLRKHVIIGANAVILPGVEIGEGAAVAAGSVIREDCQPWTTYAGNPARPFWRRPADQIRALEAQLRAACYDEAGRYLPRAARAAR